MKKKPNIVFIFSDQQRWDTMGCYGQKLDTTPNLDKLAEDGVRFDKTFTCQPVCGPARSCLQTGQFATRSGCYRNDIALPQGAKTVPKYLTQVGYDVGYVGKWHLGSTGGDSNEDIGEPFDCGITAIPMERRGGFDGYFVAADVLECTSHGYDGYMFNDMDRVDFEGYRADCTTDFALTYLDKQEKEKPFYLFISYIEPHHQNDRNCFEGPDGSKKTFENFTAPGDLINQEGNWKENYPDYLGCCNSIDKNVGRIMDKLKDKDMDDDTIIVYTSDHGSHFMTRNKEYKRSCHEGSIRIPLIIHGGKFKGGIVVDELVSLIDLPATILHMAGVKVPSNFDGHSVTRLIDGSHEDWQKDVLIQISESQVGRAIRTDKWKYSVKSPNRDRKLDSWSEVYVEEFLYNLDKDPHEQYNLVDDPCYEDVRSELKDKLINRMVRSGERKPEIFSR